MSFQIHALPESSFADYSDLSEEELKERNAKKVVVDEYPGYPCRVSLDEAKIGETALLVNYQHLPHDSPYQASHAVYVRMGAKSAQLAENEVPESVLSRLIAVRGYSEEGSMLDAEIVDGHEVAVTIEKMFNNTDVDFLHLHNAKRGCFAARVTRGA